MSASLKPAAASSLFYCSKSTCSAAILRTNGSRVTRRKSNRYELQGKVTQGDASLTITKLTMKDEGTYCCKVMIPGPSNDVKKEINLKILGTEAENVIGSINDTVTLPCAYSAGKQVTRLRWRRCGCSQLGCPDAINWTNNSGVITKSSRYHILRNITQGDVSLTITSLTMEDEGVYCCKVYIQGPSNDVKKEVTIQILANGERLKWNTPANVIRGIIIFLVPTIFLLIYKCCSLQS
ncbi:junctional adhesion molecule-like isoform X1 [Rhinoderma darwinii]|uniref:junctional adhesion molecule-like isoform X1 n=1 Tax=Rhinoderma darwinii TaxID=43563 RepID=UPI003F679037